MHSPYCFVLFASFAWACAPRAQSPSDEAAAKNTAQTKAATKAISTSLTAPECITLEVQAEGGNSTQRCPGVSGYALLVLDSDARMSVTVVDPRGRYWPLSYEQVISPHFTSLGPVAEWRVLEQEGGSVLMALAVKVNASEDPESDRTTSYWAVAKVAPTGSCVTERVEAGANDTARLDAALSAVNHRPCLLAK
jgi:hypothetical protein